MTPTTPGSRVANPPTPAAGAQHRTGSHVATVHDPIVVTHCLQPTTDDRHLCLRLRGHIGGCIAWNHWPSMTTTPDNPKWKAA